MKNLMHIVIVGHVDHGKSTLIGRLLYDTDSLPDGKYEELKTVSEKRGMPIEWSFALDSFQAERDQAVTIDTTRIWFKTEKRDYVIIDAPGHKEFLKNMISGAAAAEGAVLVVDAIEGLQEQTRRHAYLLHLLGLKQVTVVINKMDMVDFDQTRFEELSAEVTNYLTDLGIDVMSLIPISARHGQNIATKSDDLNWYKGDTLLETLDKFTPAQLPVERPLRFPVQDVYRHGDKRIIAGRIESGSLKQGDQVIFSPSNRQATVTSIETWPEQDTPVVKVQAGQSVGMTLDRPIYVERGDVCSHEQSAPILTSVFRVNIFWLGRHPMEEGGRYKLKLGTREANVTVQSIDRVINTDNLATEDQDNVGHNTMAEVTLRSREVLALDCYEDNATLGRCVILDGYDVVGGGTINMDGYADQRYAMMKKGADNLYEVDHLLTSEMRSVRNGHDGAVIWFTGLSGAGKSTLAMRVERKLFDKGIQTYVMDGDNVRQGLNADLDFSPESRAENIRRVGEVAALMADAGLVSISAFISPYRADRRRAREAASQCFHEIYIKADVDTCAKRDPKGLYERAKKGEIKDFTGISSPYEEPDKPELIIDTSKEDIETCVEKIVSYIENHVCLDVVNLNNSREKRKKNA